MGRIIAITNQKGGVGKTTTAINLSACLAEAGQRVLAVDFDPQGNTTSGLGLEKGNLDNTVYELLMGECKLEECIFQSVQERLDVMPSDMDLSGAEIELLDIQNKESILKDYLEKVEDKYDFIIIDCPPSINLLTINALTAADTMQFWPFLSTWIIVWPDTPSVFLTKSVLTPDSASSSSSFLPSFLPTAPACHTCAPARAMAIDWFSPLPPQKTSMPRELIVSPGRIK